MCVVQLSTLFLHRSASARNNGGAARTERTVPKLLHDQQEAMECQVQMAKQM